MNICFVVLAYYCRGWLNALVSGDSVPALAMLVTCYEIVSNNNVMALGSPRANSYVKCVGYSEGCVPPAEVDSQKV